MSCRKCEKRLLNLFPRLGFTEAYQGWWERKTRRGKVVLDLKPRYHIRAAILALIVRVVL
jgi:hypothetical protein